MAVDHFVGRQDAVHRLADVLTGRERASGMLTVQSIEGPGGIGKTYLFDHVRTTNDLSNRNYLTLRIDGSDPSARSLVRSIARMVKDAQADAIRDRPSGYYFPSVDRVTKAIDTIRNEAVAEFKKLHPNDEDGWAALVRFLDLAIEAGKRLNDVVPITKKHFNVRAFEKVKCPLVDIVPTLRSLGAEGASILQRLNLFGESTALRNAIKENACRPLADALVSDLSAILKKYRTEDRNKAMPGKVQGIDRLLLILDDYETLQEPLGEFLVGHLLPALRTANFESTVIVLGRDMLEATHTAWDHHLKTNLLKRIAIDSLLRGEMDQMVESYGVCSADEKDRAWRDTQGYPYYVQLWTEEAQSGGRSAVMLKRFYDRTTRWMNDTEKRWLQYTLFLDAVTIRSLRNLLDDQAEAEEVFRWFEKEGSVRDTTGASFRVREYLRSRLVDYLRLSDPDRCDELERRVHSGSVSNG